MQARKRFHQELHLPAPSPGTCRLPGRREMNVCAEPQPGCGHGSRAQCRLFPSRLSASRPFSAFPRFPLGGRGRVRAGDTPVRPEQGPSARQGGAQRLGLGWILGHECDAAPVAGAPFLRPLSPPPGSGTISTAISPAGWPLTPRSTAFLPASAQQPLSSGPAAPGLPVQFPRENLIGSAYLAPPPDWLLLGQVSTLSQSVLADGASHMFAPDPGGRGRFTWRGLWVSQTPWFRTPGPGAPRGGGGAGTTLGSPRAAGSLGLVPGEISCRELEPGAHVSH